MPEEPKEKTREDEENQRLEVTIIHEAGGTEGGGCDQSWDCQEEAETTEGM